MRKKIKQYAKTRDLSHLRTKESIDKQRKTISGENHWNWQGGKTGESRKLRNSCEYKKWRTAIFKRDNYTCQICNKRGGFLEADHIKAWSQYPNLRFSLSNGRTLCVECHRQTDNFGYKATNV